MGVQGLLRMRVCSLSLAVLIGGIATAQAATIDLQLSSPQDVYRVGDAIDISVSATVDELLVGFGFDLLADNASRVALDSFAPGPGFVSAATPDGDGLAGLAFDGGEKGSVLLGTAQFTATGIGAVNFDLGVTPGDLTEGFARFGTGFFDFTANSFSIVVLAPPLPAPILGGGGGGGDGGPDIVVPEPATAMLLMTGAMFIARSRRRPL